MSYTTENELETFGFKDAYITKVDIKENQITFTLEGVIVKGENKNNTQYTDSYAKDLSITLYQSKIERAYKEGFKYYNANDELIKEVPNEDLSVEDFEKLLKSLEEPYLYAVSKVSGEGPFVYEFGIEERLEMEAGNTYWFQASFEKSITTFEGFLNRVQYS